MSFVRHFPLLSIIVAFLGVVLCSLLPRKAARFVAFFCEGLCTLFGVALLVYTLSNGSTVYQMGHLTEGTRAYWFLNVIRFGTLEAILATAFPLVLMLSLLGGLKKLEADVSPEKEHYYYVLANLALVALLALVYADDIFTGYVFLEISTLSSIGLIAVKDKGRTTVAAIRYMIFNLVGSGLYLIGIVLLYDLTGYFMFEKIEVVLSSLVENGSSTPVVTCSLALITMGLGIKSGLFPFYFWMADTYGESTTSSASIISGLISKGYLFLLIKLVSRAFGYAKTVTLDGAVTVLGVTEKTGILEILFFLGIGGMIFGSVSALFEKRINKMIAYSSAAQIGYIYLALGLGEIGLVAALFQILAHTVTKPLLFISARGLIDASDHHPQFKYLRGSGRRNVFAGVGFFIGAMSMIGFPALSGFLVKYLYLSTALADSIPRTKLVLTIIALVVSTLLNTGYMIHTVITIYSPADREYEAVANGPCKNRIGFVVSVVVLIALNVFLGTEPAVLSLLEKGVADLGQFIL